MSRSEDSLLENACIGGSGVDNGFIPITQRPRLDRHFKDVCRPDQVLIGSLIVEGKRDLSSYEPQISTTSRANGL